jgi:hypothetical protein
VYGQKSTCILLEDRVVLIDNTQTSYLERRGVCMQQPVRPLSGYCSCVVCVHCTVSGSCVCLAGHPIPWPRSRASA